MEKMKEYSVDGVDEMPNTSDPDFYKIILDCSSSMRPYENVVIDCLKNYKRQLLNIDEESSIYIAKGMFADRYEETEYKRVDDFSTDYNTYRCTDLYGAIVKSVASAKKKQEELINNAFEPRMTNIILTDGEHCCDNCYYNKADAKNAVKEAIERGINMVFIDFGNNNGVIPKKLGFQTVYSCEQSIEALKEIFVKITTSCIRQSQSKIVDPENWLI